MSEIITTDTTEINENFCLVFSLENKIYGININNVIGATRVPKLDTPQKMPKHILGIMTYNNMPVKVIDLNSILTGTMKPYTINSHIILAKTDEAILGLMVDKIIDVRQIKSANIQSLPYLSEENLVQYLYKSDNIIISILDLNSVQAVLQKRQFELNDCNINDLSPKDEKSLAILNERQIKLVKKFENTLNQVFFDQEQFIIFLLNNNTYAVDIKNIKEIVNPKSISLVKLPKKYQYLKGIFSLRGEFISLFNFAKLLNLPAETPQNKNEMIIVLEHSDFKVSMLIDKIVDIITVFKNTITVKSVNKFDSQFITGEFIHNDKVISIIDLNKLLNDNRIFIND